MAESQYSADSARDPDAFPRPLMRPGALRRAALLFVANDGDPAARHPFAPVGIVPAEASFTSITLHS